MIFKFLNVSDIYNDYVAYVGAFELTKFEKIKEVKET